jgi:acetyltransferase-like isoleucine patch superfamily enzyme
MHYSIGCEVDLLNWCFSNVLEKLLLKIKRAETPFFRMLRRTLKAVWSSGLPVPRLFYPLLRGVYSAQTYVVMALRWMISYFYRIPVFRSRCEQSGKRLFVWRLPYIMGHAKIYVGDDVNFFGHVDIFSGRLFDEPKLVIGNRVDIGHNVFFMLNKEITIEDDVNIAGGVRFMDTDGHPRDADERAADLPPKPEDVKPVRICKKAWIGQGTMVLKGVTIGEGAIIGVNSVVVSDIPAYTVAMGNPARVVVKDISRQPRA